VYLYKFIFNKYVITIIKSNYIFINLLFIKSLFSYNYNL